MLIISLSVINVLQKMQSIAHFLITVIFVLSFGPLLKWKMI